MPIAIPPRTQALLTRMDQGFDPNFLFFWGHRPAGSAVDKSCLSQWFEGAPFVIDGIRYATAEHFMMAEKARLFDDKNTLAKILKAPSADAAKKLGRQVQGFDGKRWDARGFDAVVEGNVAKFSQHAGLKGFLLGTQGRVLVEASPVDNVWGIEMSSNDPRAMNPRQWMGPNLLGFALMDARDRIAAL